MKQAILTSILGASLALCGCTSNAERVERTTTAMAGMICEGALLEDPWFQSEHIAGLQKDPNRKEVIAQGREALVPDLNAALATVDIGEKDLEAYTNAIAAGKSFQLIDAIYKSVNEQCPNNFLNENTQIQHAISALVVLYAPPEMVR